MERTTFVQHIRKQEKSNPGATGEFTSLMNEIILEATMISVIKLVNSPVAPGFDFSCCRIC